MKALGKTKYDDEAKNYDKAIQVHIDSKRNPEHITDLYNKLTPEQQKLVDLSQNLPDNIKALTGQIKKSYEDIGFEALESDVIKNVLDNYAGRIWDIPKEKGTPFRKFGTNFNMPSPAPEQALAGIPEFLFNLGLNITDSMSWHLTLSC